MRHGRAAGPMTLAMVSVRCRNTCNGTSGCGASCASISTKATSSAKAAAMAPTVTGEPQDRFSALMMPYTNAVRPAVTVTAPGRSRWR